MKSILKTAFAIATLAIMAGCNKYKALEYEVDMPESVALQEDINSYPALKSYINRTAHPNFKWGAALSLPQYINKTVMYRLVNRNFDEIVMGYEMKHGAIVANDGTMSLENVAKLVHVAREAGTSIYGHTLAWHANQNATYLKSLIAPIILPSTGPSWDLVSGNNFETADAANYQANANAQLSFTAVGQGATSNSRALKITNSAVRANDWEAQLFFTLPTPTKLGEQYEFTMDVRADEAATFPTQANTAPGAYKHWDFFGSIGATTAWTNFSNKITITASTEGCNTIAFNLGAKATSYYFDNVTIKKYNALGGGAAGTHNVANFEGNELGDAYPMTNGGSSEVVNDPTNESGKVLNIKGAQTHPRFSVTLPLGVTLGNCKTLIMDFRGTGSTGLFGQGMRMSIDGGALVAYPSPSALGATDGTWGREVIKLAFATMPLTDAQKKLTTFTLEVGSGTGSANYFIDNVKIQWEATNLVVEKTAAEKDSLISEALEKFIAAMSTVTKDHVKAWDVVNEPMDDGRPSELKTGVGRTNMAADEFYWQDYMGKDYGVKAFQFARKYGNPTDIHFINDYNLEYNLDKTRGIIEYVKYIESKGAKVDGIGTQMHIDINSDKTKIEDMFKLLAATGKLIKISELDLGLGGVTTANATMEQLLAQAEMYKFVIDKYFQHIPAAQRYGITIWSPLDSPAGSSWRANEPIGLWTTSFVRKIAYKYVAQALEQNAK